MPDYREETKQWLLRAKLFDPPFGHSYRNGTLLLSLVKNVDDSIRKDVVEKGLGWWRGVDEQRARRLNLSAKLLRGRVQWDPAEPAANGFECKIKLFIPQPHPEAQFYPEDDDTCGCLVVGKGPEVVVTSCHVMRQHLESRFFAEPGKGSVMSKRDWLLAIAKGVEGIPGAKILLGPLIKLREDEKAQERNEQIDRMFARHDELSQEALDAVLDLRDQHTEVRALSQIALRALDSAFKRERGEPFQELDVSRFPLPIKKGLVIQELGALWPTAQDDMRVCLRQHDYQDFEEEKTSSFVIAFVDSMPGNERAKLAAVFSCLSKKRPDSKILAFAAEFLNAS